MRLIRLCVKAPKAKEIAAARQARQALALDQDGVSNYRLLSVLAKPVVVPKVPIRPLSVLFHVVIGASVI